jgi:hypothetical protein
MGSDYELHPDGRFVIRNFNQKKPFSNFLPGIAGLTGIPMWVFYVNRGQGIASFGTKNKDNAILEFFPANKAYQTVTSLGFRTFLKGRCHGKPFLYEPFRELPVEAGELPEQVMEVSSHELVIRERNRALGLEITITYFTVPGEPLAALAREISFTNLSREALSLEVLDGLPAVNPFGMNQFFMKHMSRTIEAWMITENLERKAPFFRLKVDATDRPEVTVIEGGNFFFGGVAERGGLRLLDLVVDPAVIFGSVLDFSFPKHFARPASFKVPAAQVRQNKTPCAFAHAAFSIPAGRTKTLRFLTGFAGDLGRLNRYAAHARRAGYFEAKRLENRACVDAVKSSIFTATSSPAYDLYCGQTYLDNALRGGMPVNLGAKDAPLVYHAYSRKHGDLERDYNQFVLEPTTFSQGNGGYRDANQNRRNDVWFCPEVRDANIRTFMNLLQLDGFNPLVVKGVRFYAKRSVKGVLGRFFRKKAAAKLSAFLARPFQPGDLYELLHGDRIAQPKRFAALMAALAPSLAREESAEHGEGFWTDHWFYNLDLIESYLAVFPEERRELLFKKKEFTFFDDDHRVVPRQEKYVRLDSGGVRQFKAVVRDKDKGRLIASRAQAANLARTRHGKGKVYRTDLFVKLLSLFAVKFASIDAEGKGVEMEADKPSWCDALNGLPGLLGSSLPETFELKRLALFLIQSLEDLDVDPAAKEAVPEELCRFIQSLHGSLKRHFSDAFFFWDAASAAKERFRGETRLGLSGRERLMTFGELKAFLEHGREKIEVGLERAFDKSRGLHPTYFENRVTRHRVEKGRIRVTAFEQKALPFFLEGPVHALKMEKDPARRRAILAAVRKSGLYDAQLGMYKVNDSLEDVSLEIGRARVFTPGWLENESVFLHMEYKFLLEVLRGGMEEAFFEDFKKALVPFQPAARYGRSPLENSSFIASSVFPDPSAHGTGFVARLSGSTAEFLSMWLYMNIGKSPFTLGPDGKLSLRFEPHLPGFLFTKEESIRSFTAKDGEAVKVKVPKNSVAFLFLGKTVVVYRNVNRLDTFGNRRVSVKKISLELPRGQAVEFKGDTVPSPYAGRVRDEFIPRIDIELG